MTTATATKAPARLRLQDLRPESVAMEAAEALARDLREKGAALDPAFIVRAMQPAEACMRATPVYMRTLALARYAIDGVETDVDSALRFLAVLHASALDAGADLPYEPEPSTAFGLVVIAAVGRQTLRARQPLSSPQVAALTGLDRDHVNTLAASGGIPSAYREKRLPRSPWRFRATQALTTWLDERNVR